MKLSKKQFNFIKTLSIYIYYKYFEEIAKINNKIFKKNFFK